MPTFRVKGCFKENAKGVEIILEATSYKDAQRIANQKGILVLDVLVAEDSSVKDSDTPVLSSTSSESKPKSVEDQNNVLLPHRDGLILTLGMLSLCCCFPIGIANWFIANQDIKAMESGKMDSSGMGKTKAGKMLSIISLILALLVIVVAVVDPIEPTVERSFAERLVDVGVVGRWKKDIGIGSGMYGLIYYYELKNLGRGSYSMKVTFANEIFDWVYVEKEEVSSGFKFTTSRVVQRTRFNINGSIKSFRVDNEGELSGGIYGNKY